MMGADTTPTPVFLSTMLLTMASSPPQKYLFDAPTCGEIARVCARIIRAVKADNPGLTNAMLAKAIGAKDADVIGRMEDCETVKVPASLISTIGHEFGAKYIQPYMELMGLRAVPAHHVAAVNAMPALTALLAKIAAAAADGNGINHIALSGMLHELRDADGVIAELRSKAGEMGMAA